VDQEDTCPSADLGVFGLNADPAFITIAHVADHDIADTGRAHNRLEANPTSLPFVYNLATPVALIPEGPCPQRHELYGRRFRSLRFCCKRFDQSQHIAHALLDSIPKWLALRQIRAGGPWAPATIEANLPVSGRSFPLPKKPSGVI
jgi:hypothetical protein